MARGNLKILVMSFEEAMRKRKMCIVVRSFKTKRNGKAKSLKNFGDDEKLARAYAEKGSGRVVSKELRKSSEK